MAVSSSQDISLFLSGAWTTHVGSFVQVTYSIQDDHFSMDNTDIRYANSTKLGGKELVYGFDMNNNPTAEDLWNTSPAWGFRWVASDVALVQCSRNHQWFAGTGCRRSRSLCHVE